MPTTLLRRAVAEFLGTLLLVATVVGSGVMGERLAGGNVAIALLANTVATGAALITLILAFGPISGAHFNPAVTFADLLERSLNGREAAVYITAQCAGGVVGTLVAHAMFVLPLYSISTHARSGMAQAFSEFVATFGLLCVIRGCSRAYPHLVSFAVGFYITAAYWFTASTSFANPAVTIARSLSDTFSGIRPGDAPTFVLAQFAGALAATLVFRWLAPSASAPAKELPLPGLGAIHSCRSVAAASAATKAEVEIINARFSQDGN